MLIISDKAIGKHFKRVLPNEVIKGYYQWGHMQSGKWQISTYSAKEGYKNPYGAQTYRKPADIIGWLTITPVLIRKYVTIWIYNTKQFLLK